MQNWDIISNIDLAHLVHNESLTWHDPDKGSQMYIREHRKGAENDSKTQHEPINSYRLIREVI
jgi:hypothetical protein